MLHYLMIIHRDTGGLLFERKVSAEFSDLPSDLLSNMMVALNDFSKMMKIGDLSSCGIVWRTSSPGRPYPYTITILAQAFLSTCILPWRQIMIIAYFSGGVLPQ